MKTRNIIVEKTFEFSLQIIQLYRKLIDNKEYVISKQVLRSGTGIGANVVEAIAAQSRKDFISKLCIASKEARETRYWLMLLDQSKLINMEYTHEIQSSDHIINILTKIIKTSQEAV